MNRLKLDPPRGVLWTAVADPRRYRHARYHPSADLEPYVEHYWTVEWDLRGREPKRVETLPHPSVHVVFESERRSRIMGPARRFCTLLEGKGGVFAIKFTPGGFHPFAAAPVARFTDTTVRIHDVFGASGDELDRAILAQSDDQSRIDIVESFLRARLPEPDENVLRASQLAYAIAQQREILKVQDLVKRCGLGARTLQRLFGKYIGVSPKWVIQRYRLHEAAEQLAKNGAADLAELALDLGYSDQAHFAHDFKAIVGTSPAAYARMAR